MKLLNLILGRWSRRRQAMALYQRAMAIANEHDRTAALADYTAVIEMPYSPADIRAMALYNRSIVYATSHDDANAIRDLRKILETSRAAANVQLEARRKLLRMELAASRIDRNRPPDAS